MKIEIKKNKNNPGLNQMESPFTCHLG